MDLIERGWLSSAARWAGEQPELIDAPLAENSGERSHSDLERVGHAASIRFGGRGAARKRWDGRRTRVAARRCDPNGARSACRQLGP
jgi:hypothetical protein